MVAASSKLVSADVRRLKSQIAKPANVAYIFFVMAAGNTTTTL